MNNKLLLASTLVITLTGCVSTDGQNSKSPLHGLWGAKLESDTSVGMRFSEYRPDQTGTLLIFMRSKEKETCLKVQSEFTWTYNAKSLDYKQVDNHVVMSETSQSQKKKPDGQTLNGRLAIQTAKGQTAIQITNGEGRKMVMIKAPNRKLFSELLAQDVKQCIKQ